MRYRFTKEDINCRRNVLGAWVLSIMLDGYRVEHTYLFYTKKQALRKFQQEFGVYPKDYKPVATLGINNFGGLAIMEIEHGIDDYVFVTDNYGDGYTNITKNKIRYNKKGKPYFIRDRQVWYLNDFITC